MKKLGFLLTAAIVGMMAGGAQTAGAANVKVTPLGGQDGEFCRLDRALMFEDPNGTRILYDAGMTVAGPTDPRLGKVDALLVSHMHFDHVGGKRNKAPNAGKCGKPDLSVVAFPNTNVVDIALAKKAKIVTGSEMPAFFASKLKALGGNPKNSMLARFGSTAIVGGVKISTVPATHSNGVSHALIGGDLGAALKASGLGGSVGPATGYVLQFTNGLVVYLSGDTGITAEQDLVVNKFYKAKLAVMNIGDTYTTGPREAAHVINNMVKPASVIASHANEVATKGGKVVAGTRTAAFIAAVSVPVHVPLSGKVMEFNAGGICVSGC